MGEATLLIGGQRALGVVLEELVLQLAELFKIGHRFHPRFSPAKPSTPFYLETVVTTFVALLQTSMKWCHCEASFAEAISSLPKREIASVASLPRNDSQAILATEQLLSSLSRSERLKSSLQVRVQAF